MSKIITDGDNRIVLLEKLWDSDFFKIKSYVLDVENSILINTVQKKDAISKEIKKSFISVKFPSNSSSRILRNLEKYGFYYIDTEVVLRLLCVDAKPMEKVQAVREVCFNKNLLYNELGSVFSYSRFHNDMRISNKLADKLWASYIESYRPSDTKKMFVFYKNDVGVGVLLLDSFGDSIARISLISILTDYQGKNIGSSLIEAAIQYSQENNFSKILVGTQVKNIPALNFYLKNKFCTINCTNTIMHRWKD